MSDNSRQDSIALAHEVLSDPAMDEALTWLIELEAQTPDQQLAFARWLEASPANRSAFDKAKNLWNSQSVKDAASLL